MTAGSYQAMVSNDEPCAVTSSHAPSTRGKAGGRLILLSAILFALPLGGVAAQTTPEPRPAVTPLASPETDRDTARQEAANERIAAFLLSEAREELELGELRSARRRLEILVTRYATTTVSPRARRLLEQLALIDGVPIPPMPKDTGPVQSARAGDSGSTSLASRAPGTSLLEADFSASGGDRLFFADGSDEVGGRGRRVLREKATWLQRHPQIFVRVEGHSDDLGGEDVNGDIALRRAETVRDLLVEAGVSPTRLHIAAFGRENRVSPCPGSACAAQNRRAVLVLTDARGTRLSTSQHATNEGALAVPPTAGQGRTGPAVRRDR